MTRLFFITGTDTDVGKTVVAGGLLKAAERMGLRTAAIKPVAAGCEWIDGELQNADALHLQRSASLPLSYRQVNPVALAPAIAPHIAAQQTGQRLDAFRLAGFCRELTTTGADFAVVEGAGGWLVPLNEKETFADLAKALQASVILVVSMRLGCINHALLTARAIVYDDLPLAGWVANTTTAAMPCYSENLAALRERLNCPLLGEVPLLTNPNAAAVADHLNLTGLV